MYFLGDLVGNEAGLLVLYRTSCWSRMGPELSYDG